MIPNTFIDYYGDDTRWFTGVVIDSYNDPLKLNRARIRIYGIHSDNIKDIPNGDLPWAQVLTPATEGGSSGVGSTLRLENGALVFGIFLDGKQSQLPLVLGSIPKHEVPSAAVRILANKPEKTIATIQPTETSSNRVFNPDKLLKGKTNLEKAFNFFVSAEGGGYSTVHAAAICGNLQAESGYGGRRGSRSVPNGDIDPKVWSPAPEDSRGIAQWNSAKAAGNRLGLLKNFAAERDLDYLNLSTQLHFLVYEFSILNPRYYRHTQFKETTDINKATEIFTFWYENPKDRKQKAIERAQRANKIYDMYG